MAVLPDLTQMTREQLMALVAQAQARQPRIRIETGEKGTVSVYGIRQRFPVSFYPDEWTMILDLADDIRAYCRDNAKALAVRQTNAKALAAANR